MSKVRFFLGDALGIAVEVLYAFAIMLAAFCVCLIFYFKP
jgi:hypothetical protein